MAKTLLPVQKAWVPSLVRDLDPHAATKSSRAATKTHVTKLSQIKVNIKKTKNKLKLPCECVWVGGKFFITNLMDMSLSKLQELAMDREAWRATVHEVAKSRTRLSK